MLHRVAGEVDLLERHLEILGRVAEHEPIGIVTLARETGHPRHKVRYSLRTLEDAGLVEPTSDGATTTDEAAAFVASAPDRLAELAERLEGLTATGAPIEA